MGVVAMKINLKAPPAEKLNCVLGEVCNTLKPAFARRRVCGSVNSLAWTWVRSELHPVGVNSALT